MTAKGHEGGAVARASELNEAKTGRLKTMDYLIANDVTPADVEEPSPPSGLLGRVDVPVRQAELALSSGRRYELAALPEGDRLTVRGRGGAVLLRVLMTEQGPVLAFESASVEITAAGALRLSGHDVSIEARGSLALGAKGDCTMAIDGQRHTRVCGPDRLEAGEVQLQASHGDAQVRAAGRIALDGEHIGLNDDPCPQPFSWSALACGAPETSEVE